MRFPIDTHIFQTVSDKGVFFNKENLHVNIIVSHQKKFIFTYVLMFMLAQVVKVFCLIYIYCLYNFVNRIFSNLTKYQLTIFRYLSVIIFKKATPL